MRKFNVFYFVIELVIMQYNINYEQQINEYKY